METLKIIVIHLLFLLTCPAGQAANTGTVELVIKENSLGPVPPGSMAKTLAVSADNRRVAYIPEPATVLLLGLSAVVLREKRGAK